MAEKKNQDKNKKSAYKKIEEIEEKEIEELVEANEKINQKTELPEAFLKRMKELLGGEFPAFLESYEAERVQGLRWNPLKGEASELSLRYGKRFGLDPVSWCPEGYYYDQKTRPGKHALHEA